MSNVALPCLRFNLLLMLVCLDLVITSFLLWLHSMICVSSVIASCFECIVIIFPKSDFRCWTLVISTSNVLNLLHTVFNRCFWPDPRFLHSFASRACLIVPACDLVVAIRFCALTLSSRPVLHLASLAFLWFSASNLFSIACCYSRCMVFFGVLISRLHRI